MFSLPNDRTFDIAALGEPLYELAEEKDGRFRPGFGGDSSNAAVAAQRLGRRTAYFTHLGDDLFGDALIAFWKREGVDASTVLRKPGSNTGVYLVTYAADGSHRFTYLRKGSAASQMRADHVPRDLIGGARIMHLSGVSLAVCAEASSMAITIARERACAISLDTNFRPRLWDAPEARHAIDAAAKAAHLIKTSVEDASALLGLDHPLAITRYYRDLGAKVVIVTLGAAGVAAWSEEDELFGFARHPVDSVDATGAGDAFTGALLAFICEGRAFRQAVQWANAAAALSTRGQGATSGLPSRDEVMRELADG